MARGDIASNALTLRFKHGRTTIFVFADDLAPLSTIKQDLLDTLHGAYPDGLAPPPTSSRIENIAIPASIDEVLIAVPANLNDPDEGWMEIDTTSPAGAKETPKSLGLGEASMLAFALGVEGEAAFWVEFSNVDELYPEEEEEGEGEEEEES